MQILVVDDDRDIVDILSACLETFGYRNIQTAQSGQRALELIEAAQEPFDLFLLDIQMPEMTGTELCTHIRSLPDYRFAPIIMVTAMSDKSYVDAAFAAGATDYITKPIMFDELKHRVALAEKASFNAQQLAQTVDVQAQTDEHVATAPTIALSDAIPIDDVLGVLRLHAFENYLNQMNRMQFNACKLLVIGVTNISAIYERCSSRDFVDVVTDIAECLSDSLREYTPLIGYFGRGIFGIVVNKKAPVDGADAKQRLYREIEEAGLVFSDGCPVPVTLESGDVQKEMFLSVDRQTEFIEKLLRELKMAAHVEPPLVASS